MNSRQTAKHTTPILLTLALLTLAGCTPESKSPDQIRRDAANLTSTAARDARAAVSGVVDGLKTVKRQVNINTASTDDLIHLPGVDDDTAAKIVAARPYATTGELLHRHIVSKAEYERIAPLIEAR